MVLPIGGISDVLTAGGMRLGSVSQPYATADNRLIEAELRRRRRPCRSAAPSKRHGSGARIEAPPAIPVKLRRPGRREPIPGGNAWKLAPPDDNPIK